MNKEKLAKEMMECLDKHDKNYEENAIFDYIGHWYSSKGNLIDILRKHPNWNEDIMAVLFDYDYERDIDGYTYRTVLEQFQILWLESYIGKHVKLKSKNETNIIALSFDARNILGQTHCVHRILCDNELVFKINNTEIYVPIYATELSDDYYKFYDLRLHPIHIITESAKENLANVGIECSIGQKMSRVINKFFKTLGIDKYPEYNSSYARLADSISPLKITRHTLLSVHPCDYLHMSYGGSSNVNKESWVSCHNIDSGEYMAGVLSYMLDKTSMILYTVNGDYEGDEFWNQRRINRQVFCYDNYTLLQSRLYPDYYATETSDNFRTIVQQIFSTCLEKNNLWTLERSCKKIQEHILTYDDSMHYPDYDYGGYKPTISLLKEEEHGMIEIGYKSLCLICRSRIEEKDTLYCPDHSGRARCEKCDYSPDPDFLHEIDGEYYCEDCCFYCDDCEEWCIGNSYTAEGHYGNLTICEDCINNGDYIACFRCDNYIYSENAVYVEDTGDYVCIPCCDRHYYVCGDCCNTFSDSDYINDDGLCSGCAPVLELESV